MDINAYISSGIIEMYVMGLCDKDEKMEIESLRLQYPQLQMAIEAFEIALENNLQQYATQPSQHIDEQILQVLDRLQNKNEDLQKQHIAPVRKMNWLIPAVAAAIILLVASCIFNYLLYNKTRQQQLALNEKDQYSPLPINDYNILKQPSITPVAMYGVSPHSICRCTMFWDKNTSKAYIMIHHLVPAPEGKNYQMWAMVNNKPVSAGIINDKIRDRFVEMGHVPAGATGFIVTLENAGESTSPTVEATFLSGKV